MAGQQNSKFLQRLFQPGEQEVQLRALEQLAIGCTRHPSYRYHREPRAECQRCAELWDLMKSFRDWQQCKQWSWRRAMEADRERMQREMEEYDRRMNSPG